MLENLADLWDQVLKNIEQKISKPSFDTWLKFTEAYRLQGETLVVAAPNEFARDWLEGRYADLISKLLYEIIGENLEVKFIIPLKMKRKQAKHRLLHIQYKKFIGKKTTKIC